MSSEGLALSRFLEAGISCTTNAGITSLKAPYFSIQVLLGPVYNCFWDDAGDRTTRCTSRVVSMSAGAGVRAARRGDYRRVEPLLKAPRVCYKLEYRRYGFLD